MAAAFAGAVVLHAWAPRPLFPGFAWALSCAMVLPLWHAAMRRPVVRLALLATLAFLLGCWRFETGLPAAAEGSAPPPKEVRFEGRLAEEPRVTPAGATLFMDRVFFFPEGTDDAGATDGETATTDVGKAHVRVADRSVPTRMSGRLRMAVTLAPRVEVGDTLAWRCHAAALRGPGANPVADAVWRCTPRLPPTAVTVAAGDKGAWLARTLSRCRSAIRRVTHRLFPEPDASFVLGLLIGDTGGLPKEVVDDFRSTGSSHVLAVSGYNVSMVAEAAFLLFAVMALRRRHAAIAVAASVSGFALLSGAGAPVVRAAAMGGIGVAAELVGRRNVGIGPLLMTAALMLAIAPLSVFDVGFQLSFGAMLGMRAFGPHVKSSLAWVPEAFGLRGACADTLAAMAATLPVQLHVFGTLPLAALPANLLIVPLVPIASMAALAALSFGAVSTALGLPLSLAATVATSAMRHVAATAATLLPAARLQTTSAQSLLLASSLVACWLLLEHGAAKRESART